MPLIEKQFTEHWPLPTFDFDELKGKDLHAFEIGSFEGRSACWWFENVLLTPDCVLDCVDPWQYNALPKYANVEKCFDFNTKGLNVIKHKSYSFDWLIKQKEAGFDFGYIDGWHEGFQVLEDLVLSWRIIKVGGFLLCDDYTWQGKNVTHPPKLAIDTFIKLHSSDCTSTFTKRQVKLTKVRGPQQFLTAMEKV